MSLTDFRAALYDFDAGTLRAAIDAGFAPDYVQALDAATLEKVSDATNAIVVAGAAYLGKARLIDNLVVTL